MANYLKNENAQIEKINGVFLAIITIFITTFLAFLVLRISLFLHFIAYLLFAILILKLTLCIKLESDIAKLAAEAVRKNDLQAGRENAAMFSRREVDELSGSQIVSAVIESMAENLTDFKLSPLFYYSIFGVIGAVAFKTINILDGTVGFRDKEHINVGWFSALLDTIANFVMSRLTALFIVLSSFFCRENFRKAWRIMIRDRRKVPSINHGWPVAAIAGSLDVSLEKPGYYVVGDGIQELTPEHMFRALKIRNVAIILFLVLVEVPILLAMSYFFGLRI
jgi:adenosylcobinamide-phosphate synthase